MSAQAILSVALLMAIIGLTPGPLSLMSFAYGARLGLRPALPFLVGGSLGYGLLSAVCCLSLAGALQSQPDLILPAKLLSAAILIWFSWKIASDGAIGPMHFGGRRALFIEGCAMQSVNPKAWAAGLAVATRSMDTSDPMSSATTAGVLVFGVIFCALLVWTASGQRLRLLLADCTRRRIFNYGMAGALLGVGLPGIAM